MHADTGTRQQKNLGLMEERNQCSQWCQQANTHTPPPPHSLFLSVGNNFPLFKLPDRNWYQSKMWPVSLKSAQLTVPQKLYRRHDWANVIMHWPYVGNTCWPLKKKQEITSSLAMLVDVFSCPGAEKDAAADTRWCVSKCVSVCECVYVEGWRGQCGHRWLSCLIMIITAHLRPPR